LTEARLWLIRIQSAPYEGQRATLGVDAALACGAFGQSAALLLEAAGRQVLQEAAPPDAADRNLYKLVASLPLYDIDTVYISGASGEDSPVDRPKDLRVVFVNSAEVAELVATSRHVLSF